jgi:para-nitrobenzyl esterase
MYRYHLLFSLLTFVTSANAFTYCGSGRYDTEVFATFDLTSNIVYGSNMSYSGTTVNLNMDIYEPHNDTATIRPLIVWAHGGSFVGGTKTDADIVALCQHFAKRGYVCVSINYRAGVPFPPTTATVTQAVWRAV